MVLLTAAQAETLRAWALPDRTGTGVPLHVLNTGCGTCHADRWPSPRATLWETEGNYCLLGDPRSLSPDDLRPRIRGFLDAPPGFDPLVRKAFPDAFIWVRVMFALHEAPDMVEIPGYEIRPLRDTDAPALGALGPETSWASTSWGGPEGLARSGYAWGAIHEDSLAAVACSFTVGDRYEDIGVATEPPHRGRGLSVACAAGLCREILERGRIPSWTTSPDNKPSFRVAQKLGFQHDRDDRMYIIGIPVPEPARHPVPPRSDSSNV